MTTAHQPAAVPLHSEFAARLLRNDPAVTDPRFKGDASTAPVTDDGYETTDDDDRFDAG